MKLPLWLIKITTYEYWTWWAFYIPLLPYWLYLAVKTRSLTFFTNANTCIEYGGFFGESKKEILAHIPSEYLPKSLFVEKETTFSDLKEALINQFSANPFPIICKPNVGERGTQVEKICDWSALATYLSENPVEFIIQEYIDFEIELGVLYHRLPSANKGQISSITRKEFLAVTGDGKSTIEELMQQQTRARFQLESMRQRLGKGMQEVLPLHEKRILEPIGNHCRGTKFLDNNFLITSALNDVFDKIALPIEGFHYGRFDMRVKSLEDLYEGKNIRIMELNGVSSEPGHIYDPIGNIWKAYRDLAHHWKIIANISIEQQQRGIQPVPYQVILRVVKGHFGL